MAWKEAGLRRLTPASFWPGRKPAFGQRSRLTPRKPALAEEAGLHRPKPASSGRKSRLTPAEAGSSLAERAGLRRLTPALSARKKPAHAGLRRLLPLAKGAGLFKEQLAAPSSFSRSSLLLRPPSRRNFSSSVLLQGGLQPSVLLVRRALALRPPSRCSLLHRPTSRAACCPSSFKVQLAAPSYSRASQPAEEERRQELCSCP